MEPNYSHPDTHAPSPEPDPAPPAPTSAPLSRPPLTSIVILTLTVGLLAVTGYLALRHQEPPRSNLWPTNSISKPIIPNPIPDSNPAPTTYTYPNFTIKLSQIWRLDPHANQTAFGSHYRFVSTLQGPNPHGDGFIPFSADITLSTGLPAEPSFGQLSSQPPTFLTIAGLPAKQQSGSIGQDKSIFILQTHITHPDGTYTAVTGTTQDESYQATLVQEYHQALSTLTFTPRTTSGSSLPSGWLYTSGPTCALQIPLPSVAPSNFPSTQNELSKWRFYENPSPQFIFTHLARTVHVAENGNLELASLEIYCTPNLEHLTSEELYQKLEQHIMLLSSGPYRLTRQPATRLWDQSAIPIQLTFPTSTPSAAYLVATPSRLYWIRTFTGTGNPRINAELDTIFASIKFN